MIDIEAIKASTSMLDLIQTAHRVGHDWRCACPIHGGKDINAFSIYDNGQRWKCFSGDCGSGDVIAFIMARDQVGFIEAVKILGGDNTVISPEDARKMAEARVLQTRSELEEKQREYDEAVRDLSQAQAWEEYHANLTNSTRSYYRNRGISDEWQNLWKFGYNPSFPAMTKQGKLITPTMTIPIFDTGWQIKNIRHRLLNPMEPTDKYRPQNYGLPTFPFMCDPDIGWDTERILFWEGEFKAATLFATMNMPDIQVFGMAGKNQWRKLVDKAKGHKVFIGFDPGSEKEAVEFARACGGAGVIALSQKVDDAIVKYGLDRQWAQSLLKTARPVK